ncbi:poly [ADP-ribose] polymerase 1-like [Sitodiplosis mosellana]|uniref:poly [ADP-ribose] polymerase 1-like n=1 Tax=Sitodiplosis mosellana TaxID=263140 RepID=UPI002444316F|nr:poly [ADP-ribose] polymerase 1-like [Sitodiplosis mosellana]
MEHIAHVYVANELIYSAVLVKIDLSADVDKNSQYRIQLLESDDENPRKYWIFRSWGRTGTIIGKTSTSDYYDVKEAIEQFHKIYKEKTNNEFTATHFIKYPGKYHRLTTSDEAVKKAELTQSNNLSKPVEDLLKLLVDEDMMNNLMIVFRLDTTKTPLAKIGQIEIRQANFVLKAIKGKIIQRESQEQLVEASNRFYSLIPHSVTADDVIDGKEKLKEKAEMLKSLKDLQFTYKLLHKETGEKAENILDDFYNDLNVDIESLDKDSYEFDIITTYANETQMTCDLEIVEIFKISRCDEQYYEPYENLPNRTLLWHGSRIINVASILSQGLKIAPPEASAIGCSFGKGLYFVDVFEKSAGYCYAHQTNNIGLMLLCGQIFYTIKHIFGWGNRTMGKTNLR